MNLQPSNDGNIEVTAPSSPEDDRSAVSSVTDASKSTSTSALMNLVERQAEMLRSLNEANIKASDGLRLAEEGRLRAEEDLRNANSFQQQRSQPSGETPVSPVIATATSLGTISESHFVGSRSWVPFAPSFPPRPAALQTNSKGFPDVEMPTPPMTPSPTFESSGMEVEVFGDIGPRVTAAPGGRRSVSFLTQQPYDEAPPPQSEAQNFAQFSTRAFSPTSERDVMMSAAPTPVATAVRADRVHTGRAKNDGAVGAKSSAERRLERRFSNMRKSFSFRRQHRSSTAPPNPSRLPKKTIALASTDAKPPLKIPQRQETCGSKVWATFAVICTSFIPNMFICKNGSAAKLAWREKVATCVVMFLTSVVFVGGFGFVPLFFCKETTLYSWEDIWSQNSGVFSFHRDAWTVINGIIYDVEPFISKHSGGSQGIVQFLGKDASRLFPRLPASELPPYCLNPDKDKAAFDTTVCTDLSDLDELVGVPCHNFVVGPEGIKVAMGDYQRGILVHPHSKLNEDTDLKYIIIHDKVIFPGAWRTNNIYEIIVTLLTNFTASHPLIPTWPTVMQGIQCYFLH